MQNYTNITPICRRFGKLPGHLKDNRLLDKSKFRVVGFGCKAHTEIHDDLLPAFLKWLDKSTHVAYLLGDVELGLRVARGEE